MNFDGQEVEEDGDSGGGRGGGCGGWRVAPVVLLIYDSLTVPTQGGLQSGRNSGFLKPESKWPSHSLWFMSA